MFKSGRLKSIIRNLKSAIRNWNSFQPAIQNQKSETGIALVVALILMLAIITLGSAYLLLTISESRRAKVDEHYIQGLPSAEGGADHALWRLQNDGKFLTKVVGLNPGETSSYSFLPPGNFSDTVTVIVRRN